MPLITAGESDWWLVVAMSGLMILLTVDFFGITVALPRIAHRHRDVHHHDRRRRGVP